MVLEWVESAVWWSHEASSIFLLSHLWPWLTSACFPWWWQNGSYSSWVTCLLPPTRIPTHWTISPHIVIALPFLSSFPLLTPTPKLSSMFFPFLALNVSLDESTVICSIFVHMSGVLMDSEELERRHSIFLPVHLAWAVPRTMLDMLEIPNKCLLNKLKDESIK